MTKRVLTLVFTVLLAVLLAMPTTALAAKEPADGAEVTLTTQKEAYAEGEDIRLTLTVRNPYDHPITNLWAALTEEDFSLLSGTSLPAGDTLTGGEVKNYPFTLTTGTQDGASRIAGILPVILIIMAVAALAALIIFLVLRKKNGAKAAISVVLVLAMMGGFLAMPVQVLAAGPQRLQFHPSVEVTVGDTKQVITLNVTFDHDPLGDALQLNLAGFGYREDLDAYVVPEDFRSLQGSLKTPKDFSSIQLEVYDSKDHLLSTQTVSASAVFTFSPVGLLPGLNRVRLTAVGSSLLTLDLNLYDPYLAHYPLLENADTDTDEDGLYDLLENTLGLDPANTDTDGDGLSDYEEVCTSFTNPLKGDSDGNGIADSDEDPDGDGMTVNEELERGLSTILADTDRDGIADADEIRIYGTDPVKADSDEDGAEDGWELEHGYSPYSPNATFQLSCETSGVSEAFPVSASAAVSVNGTKADVTSLAVSRVSASDSPFLSHTISGYLGEAVDFTLDGSFESATLTFRYDTSLGTIGPDFQPRIYYLNEVTGELEELPNQTVYNGTVIAQTSHFSIYLLINSVLLNKVFAECYDAAMEYYTNTKGYKEEVLASLGSADIVMVMDRSASMAWSDPSRKAQEVAQYFVDHMRQGYDNAALLTYTREAEVVCPLTADVDTLHQAIHQVLPDNGVQSSSGTDGAAALLKALSCLENGPGSYGYILFFSDGDDSSLQARFDEIVSRAVNRQIQILCVGINTPESSILADLASKTEGKYIVINDFTDVPTAFQDALAVFDAITPSDEDTNKDGISDYLTKLICDGKIPTQNGAFSLFGVDFSINAEDQPSADWDGDGVINGDEIRFVVKDGKAYLKMRSNPCRIDSDLDGFSDKTENDLDMDPMVYSIQQQPLDVIMNSTLLYLSEVYQYDEDYLPEDWRWLTDIRDMFMGLDALIFAGGDTNRKEVYWETMAQYFCDYGQLALLENVETNEIMNGMLDLFDTLEKGLLVKTRTEAGKIVDTLTSPARTARELHFAEWKLTQPNLDAATLERLYSDHFPKLLGDALKHFPEKLDVKWKDSNLLKKVLSTVGNHADDLEGAMKALDDYGKTLGKVGTAMEVIQVITTFSRINADCEIFLANQAVLDHIEKYSQDDYAAAAAKSLSMSISDNYWKETGAYISHMAREGLQAGWDPLVTFAASKIPVVGTFVTVAKVVLSLTDLVAGVSKELESTYKLLTYYELSKAYTALIQEAPDQEDQWMAFAADSTKLNPWLCSIYGLAQVHAVGENHFIEHFDIITGVLAFFKRNQVKERVGQNVARLNTASNAIRQRIPFDDPHPGLK